MKTFVLSFAVLCLSLLVATTSAATAAKTKRPAVAPIPAPLVLSPDVVRVIGQRLVLENNSIALSTYCSKAASDCQGTVTLWARDKSLSDPVVVQTATGTQTKVVVPLSVAGSEWLRDHYQQNRLVRIKITRPGLNNHRSSYVLTLPLHH